MARIRISELLKDGAKFLGQKIEVKGWVRAFRSKRFVQLNDGSCMSNIQGVLDYDNFDEEQLKAISTGAAVCLKGILIESQGSGQVVELQVESFDIIGSADPEAVQKTILQPKKHSLDLLREQAHLRFRTNTFGAVFRIRHAASFAIHQFFNDRGFNYIHTPILTGSDAEGAGEMFRVSTFDPKNPPLDEDGDVDYGKDFFGKQITAHISKYNEYPSIAQRRSMEGDVIIEIQVKGDGTLISKYIKKSSGYKVLDKAAMVSIEKSLPLPAGQYEQKDKLINLLIPFRYSLVSN